MIPLSGICIRPGLYCPDQMWMRLLVLLLLTATAVNGFQAQTRSAWREAYQRQRSQCSPQGYMARIRGASILANLQLCRESNVEDSIDESSASSFGMGMYTLEYSPNFHRHVVRFNGTVIRSFLWLDEAVQRFPFATMIPLDVHSAHRHDTCLYETNNSGVAAAIRCEKVAGIDDNWAVAGGGLSHSTTYPRTTNNPLGMVDQATLPSPSNRDRVFGVLQSLLKWYPTQVERLMERWPPLKSYPAPLLEERLQFLLAPLPIDPFILEQANVTDDIDWPCIFYRDGCGAGMTVGQVSHALQVLPEPLLLRLDANTYNERMVVLDDDSGVLERPTWSRSESYVVLAESMTQLYEETPPLVVQMTLKVLHLWVTGVTHLDVLSLAYLHWRGWEWQACRIVLHAFRSSLTSSVDTISGVRHRPTSSKRCKKGERPSTAAAPALLPTSLSYLQARLQIRPWHIHAMLNTHSRLAGYTPDKVKRNLDFLQERLQLSSAQLQSIILVMPSLLGAGTPALESRLDFWAVQVGLTPTQLRDVVLQKPALLQYSVDDNLGLKFAFFLDELGLSASDGSTPLLRMTCANPDLWGRSLDRFLRPLAYDFVARLDNAMTLAEFGQIVSRVPELFRYSASKLVYKLDFLKSRLGLTETELASMIQSTPRVLLQSVATSLEPKIDLAEKIGTAGSHEAIKANPSLLVISTAALKQRLEHVERYPTSAVSMSERMVLSSKAARARKAVWLLSNANDNEVELELSDVAAAAMYAGTSQSNMYRALRLNRLLNGRRFVYAETLSTFDAKGSLDCPPQIPPVSHDDPTPEPDIEEDAAHLTIHTAGRAFPPEDTVRGRRRSGGLALQIRTWSSAQWREMCSQMWKGQRLRLLPDSQTLILGYPYTRSSRPRCSLYACHEALRVASQWLSQVQENNVTITIVCESNYVLDLLRNSSQLVEWGSAESKANFVYTGPGPLHQANSDILYPLSRLVFQLCNRRVDISKDRSVNVQFIASEECERSRRLRDGARLAAKLMYDSVR